MNGSKQIGIDCAIPCWNLGVSLLYTISLVRVLIRHNFLGILWQTNIMGDKNRYKIALPNGGRSIDRQVR